MNQDDRDQVGGQKKEEGTQGTTGGQGKPGGQGGQGGQGFGDEQQKPTGTSGREGDQKEEKERNPNQPESEPEPGGNRNARHRPVCVYTEERPSHSFIHTSTPSSDRCVTRGERG